MLTVMQEKVDCGFYLPHGTLVIGLFTRFSQVTYWDTIWLWHVRLGHMGEREMMVLR